MGIFILLDDGTLGTLILTPLEADPNSNTPIDLIPLGEPPAQHVFTSFVKAKTFTHNYLVRKRKRRPEDHSAFAYEILDRQGMNLIPVMTGESAGLAMALALILHILNERLPDVDVAATGVITDVGSGKIAEVGSLEEKLRGAIRVLKANSIVFYPLDNENKAQIPDSLRKEAADKGLRLEPVSAIEQAVRFFIREKEGYFPALMRAALYAFIFLIAYFSYSFISYPLTLHWLQNGKIGLAERYLSVAKHIVPWNNGISLLYNGLNDHLNASISFCYLLSTGEEGLYRIDKIPKGLNLGSSDGYAFQIISYEASYLYILQIDSFGEILFHFPNHALSTFPNPLQAVKEVRLPDGKRWLHPTGYKGTVEVYFFLSRWRCNDIESLVSCRSRRAGSKLKERLSLIIDERDRLGRGTMMETVVFWHK